MLKSLYNKYILFRLEILFHKRNIIIGKRDRHGRKLSRLRVDVPNKYHKNVDNINRKIDKVTKKYIGDE